MANKKRKRRHKKHNILIPIITIIFLSFFTFALIFAAVRYKHKTVTPVESHITVMEEFEPDTKPSETDDGQDSPLFDNLEDYSVSLQDDDATKEQDEDTSDMQGEDVIDSTEEDDAGQQDEDTSDSQEEASVKTVICVGDSITYGDGVDDEDESYPSYLEEILGDKYEVHNKGVNARCLLNSGEYPYRKTDDYTESKELNGDIYIIMLGSNDSNSYNWNKKAFEEEYYAFAAEYMNLPSKPVVYLAIPPKAHTLPGEEKPYYDINDSIIVNDITPIIKNCAKKYGLPVLNLYSLFKDHPDWYEDGIHPNALGNRKMAEYIAPIISK